MNEQDLFNNVYNPDVLACIANLSSDEVFTPPEVVNKILDMLPQELFSDPNAKFLDPACKTGVFLREIAKRLINGLEPIIPDLNERINHIMKNQLYGIAITELTSLLSRRSLYCSKYANSKYSVANFPNVQGNIRFKKIRHIFKNENCIYCGASKDEYGRDDSLEQHAYEFIHILKPEDIYNMKFDVICSNPPYQLSDGGSGTGISAKPIYQYFIMQSIKLNPKYITMIVPSRWFAGGKGLDDFRKKMMSDKRIREIYDFMSSKDCFPGVNIAGGVNYFLWDRDNPGNCTIHNCSNSSKEVVESRALDEFSLLIRDNRAVNIIHKFLNSHDENLADHTFTRNPFGFVSKERGESVPFKNEDNVILISSGGLGYIKKSSVTKNADQIDKYKVSIGKIVPSNGEVDVDPNDGYRVTTVARVLLPGEVITESYLLLHTFDNKKEAENFAYYMALKFPRFMMKHTLTSMNISKQNFMFVPFLDYQKRWTDEELFDRYGLNSDERNYVNSFIRKIDTFKGREINE